MCKPNEPLINTENIEFLCLALILHWKGATPVERLMIICQGFYYYSTLKVLLSLEVSDLSLTIVAYLYKDIV